MNPSTGSGLTLEELYTQTPVAEHGNIAVSGDRVFVRKASPSEASESAKRTGADEYLLLPDGSLRLLRSTEDNSGAAILQDLALVKTKLGI